MPPMLQAMASSLPLLLGIDNIPDEGIDELIAEIRAALHYIETGEGDI